jgi:PAS domain S-box-containing protein
MMRGILVRTPRNWPSIAATPERRASWALPRLEDLTRLVSEWVWESDANGVLSFVSERVTEVLGILPVQLLGKRFREIGAFRAVGGDTREPDWQGPFREFRFEFGGDNGQRKTFLISGLPSYSPDTWNLEGFFGIAEDITDRERGEAALRESEERYRDIAECTGDWFFEQDSEGDLTFVSEDFERVTGIRRELLIGGKLGDLIDWDQSGNRAPDIARAVSERGPLRDAEYALKLPDGGRMWVRASANPVFASNGTFMGCRGAISDITRQKRAERASRESDERMRGAVDSLQEGFALFDADDRLVIMNDAYRLINPAAQDILERGGCFEDLLRANVQRGAILEAFGREEEFIRERVERHRNPRGAITRHVTGGGTFLLKENRTSEGGIALSFIEITELKKVEEALREAKKTAESANQAKTEFLANMSHELRTPLNSIIGFSDILSGEMFGPLGKQAYLEYARDINNAGKHLLALINDILDVSRIETGTLTLERNHLDVGAVIVVCENMVRNEAWNAGIFFRVEMAPSLPYLVADGRSVKQMLLNLLSNAMKFTPKGGTITLDVRTTASGEMVFSVSDTGIGVSPDEIPNVLSNFGQTESVYTRRYQGAGIGLPLVKSLIELQGGTLELKSEAGVGTIAAVRFPSERVISHERPSD